ncbi:unnamed protein product [Boreogadus saida]
MHKKLSAPFVVQHVFGFTLIKVCHFCGAIRGGDGLQKTLDDFRVLEPYPRRRVSSLGNPPNMCIKLPGGGTERDRGVDGLQNKDVDYFQNLEQLFPLMGSELPGGGTEGFSIQMDLIHLIWNGFEVQQVRSVMEERFGTNQLTVQRTQTSGD